MQIAASSVDDYLSRVPAEHRPALTRVRDVMRQNLPAGYEEGLLYGMACWYVPPERLAATYNGQPLMIAALASQKNYMALYLLNVDGPEAEGWFSAAFAAAGKKLDMGKSCVRFRKLEDLPLDVIAQVAARTPVDARIASYLATQEGRKQKPVVIPGRAAATTGTGAAKAAKPATTASTAKQGVAKASTAKAAAKKPIKAKASATKPSKAKPTKAKPVVTSAKAKPRTTRAATKARPAKRGKARR